VKDKKAFSRRVGDFLAGKGFYIVLFVCVAVIGVSAWILLFTDSTDDGADVVSMTSPTDYVQDVNLPSDDYQDAIEPDDEDDSSEADVPDTQDATEEADTEPVEENNAEDAALTEETAEDAMTEDIIFVWPLVGDVEVMYSVDELIYNKTMADWRTHPGIDIAGQMGSKVMAVADGKVLDVSNDDLLGTTVTIEHGSGLKSIYANLAATPVVKAGDQVAMGAVIGSVGDTAIGETNEVAHLHFAMTLNDEPVDPAEYLPK
jgi:murein DD-endopeptidase MepM/ murein hydrolase activator NlpD